MHNTGNALSLFRQSERTELFWHSASVWKDKAGDKICAAMNIATVEEAWWKNMGKIMKKSVGILLSYHHKWKRQDEKGERHGDRQKYWRERDREMHYVVCCSVSWAWHYSQGSWLDSHWVPTLLNIYASWYSLMIAEDTLDKSIHQMSNATASCLNFTLKNDLLYSFEFHASINESSIISFWISARCSG